ncbi:MAG: hypothetical protein ACK47M_25330, partial [Caldilinea sp.]
KPTDARTRLAARAEGRSDPLSPASVWNPSLSPELDAALMCGLALDPDRRFADAPAMRAALQGCTLTTPKNETSAEIRLVGRNALIREVRSRLLRPDTRLLILTGPNGVGKSCAARAVAVQVRRHFAGGLITLELDEPLNPATTETMLQQALRMQHQAGAANDRSHVISDAHKTLLLIEAGEYLAAAMDSVHAYLVTHPQVKLLIASRYRLHAPEENIVSVAPLPTPDAQSPIHLATVQQHPAVQLFVEQAQTVKPGVQLTDANMAAVVDLCVAFDGLPLALIEAARHLDMLAVEQIASHLYAELRPFVVDTPTISQHSRSLAASIAWSHTQLTPTQQALFAQ